MQGSLLCQNVVNKMNSFLSLPCDEANGLGYQGKKP